MYNTLSQKSNCTAITMAPTTEAFVNSTNSTNSTNSNETSSVTEENIFQHSNNETANPNNNTTSAVGSDNNNTVVVIEVAFNVYNRNGITNTPQIKVPPAGLTHFSTKVEKYIQSSRRYKKMCIGDKILLYKIFWLVC